MEAVKFEHRDLLQDFGIDSFGFFVNQARVETVGAFGKIHVDHMRQSILLDKQRGFRSE